MTTETYKAQIAELVNQINDDAILRRIYLILIVITGG